MTTSIAGDLRQVYPLARGSAFLIVAGVSTTLLGVNLSGIEWAAVTVIGAGLMSLTLVRRSDGLRNGRAAAMALITGGFIAPYSLVDGLGAREAARPSDSTAGCRASTASLLPRS